MRNALLNKRLDYYKKIHKIEEYEVKIDEIMDYIDEKNNADITRVIRLSDTKGISESLNKLSDTLIHTLPIYSRYIQNC